MLNRILARFGFVVLPCREHARLQLVEQIKDGWENQPWRMGSGGTSRCCDKTQFEYEVTPLRRRLDHGEY